MNDDRYQRRVDHATAAPCPLSAAAEAALVGARLEEALRLLQELWQHANYAICRIL